MNDVVDPRREKWAGPLVIGGTPVDDAIMDLIAISEMAEDSPEALRIMNELVESISAELTWLKKRTESPTTYQQRQGPEWVEPGRGES